MAVRQYIGARYVPIFGRKGEDSIQWDNTGTYEPLTVVLYQGNSYTSRQFVPVGIDITNEDYWAETGNYNAQVEQYRQEVLGFDDRITENEGDISTLESQMAGTAPSGLKTEIVRIDNVNTLQDLQLAGTTDSGLKTAIGDNSDAIDVLESKVALTTTSPISQSLDALDNRIDELSTEVGHGSMLWFGDSWSTREQGLIPNTVANMLNLTLHSYAISGSGWLTNTDQGNDNFTYRMADAIADTSFNHDLVKLIVVYGGTNDFSHNHTTPSDYTSVIRNACNSLKTSFPNAMIHVFFNTRYKYGSITYPKLNVQLRLWKTVSFNVTGERCCVLHPESAYWMINPDGMETDLVHPTVNSMKRLALRLAKSLSGGTIEFDRYLDQKEVTLASNDGKVSGSLYITAKDEKIYLYVYITVTEDVTVTTGIGAGLGMIPFDILYEAAANNIHNHISIPMGKNNATGCALIDAQLNRTDAGSDVLYLTQPYNDGGVPAGSYNGSGEFVMFI